MIPLLLISNDSRTIKRYVKSLIDNNTLLFEIRPTEKEYTIDQIKTLISETKIYNSKKRLYLLENFHCSSQEAQNSFLKLLEESPESVRFVLTTDNPNRLNPTIISRAKVANLKIDPLKKADGSLMKKLDHFFFLKDYKTLADPVFSQMKTDNGLDLIDQIIIFFRLRLSTDRKSPKVLKEILRLRNLLTQNNLNAQLTIDHILIFIVKTYSMK